MRARGLFWSWVCVVYVMTALSALSACVPYLEQLEPMIVLNPTTGGPGTSVAVSGSGFPAYVQVSVRLGPPSIGATPQSYGDATTDADGSFALALTMPAQWPDGTPITETDLVVVALNEDGSAKGTAPFRYIPSLSGASTLAANSAEAHRKVVLAWHREGSAAGFCGDVMVFEGGYVEITSCRAAARLVRRRTTEEAAERVRTWAETYRSFESERTTGTGQDRVTTRITFVGNGSRSVSEVEMRMIEALLEKMVSSL